jgi:hypothetical protein
MPAWLSANRRDDNSTGIKLAGEQAPDARACPYYDSMTYDALGSSHVSRPLVVTVVSNRKAYGSARCASP